MAQKSLSWHALDIERIAQELNVEISKGLSDDEARKRLRAYGLNEPPKQREFRLVRIIFIQLASPLALVLLGTGVGAALLGATLDAFVTLAALTINVCIGVLQEGSASKIFQALERSHAQNATVKRDGKKRVISAAFVVPGDVVYFSGGVMVPADARLVESGDIQVIEAPLTGEWKPIDKNPNVMARETKMPDQANILWSGTTIASGHGMGIVIATGDNTQLGHLARAAQRIHIHPTPLQMGVSRLTQFIIMILAGVIGITFALGVAQGRPILEVVLISIAVAVAAMPEGLPAAVSVVLAVGMREVLKHGGLVKSLIAAETLGSTTVILTDKTGTLTEGEMSVARFHTCTSLAQGVSDSDHGDNRAVLQMAVLASDAFFDTAGGKEVAHGRPMERALVNAGLTLGIRQEEQFTNGHARRSFLQFEPLRRYAASVNTHPKDGMRVYLTGTPEILLRASSHCVVADGVRAFDDETRGEFIRQQEKESALGHAIMGVAYRRVDSEKIPADIIEGGRHLKNLVFGGLIVLGDRLRPGVKQEIKTAHEAGVRVVMVTGDHAETARAIAIETGIGSADDDVITGAELAEMDMEAVAEAVMHGHIFARVTPEQKLRIVNALAERGEVVAMTGDGVNDAPALNAASVGVALGSGTDVAKGAADIILINNSFSTITMAIREGRRIVVNLGKTVAYLLSTGVTEVLLITGAIIAGVPLPLLPTQLLWTNIIHEGFMSTPFAFEPADPSLMHQKPRGLHERVLTPLLMRFAMLVSVMGAVIFLSFYIILYAFDIPLGHLRTLVFGGLSLSALTMALSFKNPELPVWRTPLLSNRALLYSLVGSFTIFILTLTLPFTRSLLSLTTLGFTDVLILVAFACANIVVVEFAKWLAKIQLKKEPVLAS